MVEPGGVVGVGIDDTVQAPLRRPAPVPPVQVESLRMGVELDGHAVRHRGIDHLRHVDRVAFALEQQPAGRMPQHGRARVFEGADDARRHFRLAQREGRVHRHDDIVELAQDRFVEIQPAVRQYVALHSGQNLRREAARLVERGDLGDLPAQSCLVETVCLEARLRMIGDAEILPAVPLGRRHHLGERVTAVGCRRMVVKYPAEVGDFDQPQKFTFLRRLDLTQSLAQLRRDVVQTKRGKKVLFGLDGFEFCVLRFELGAGLLFGAGGLSPVRFGIGSWSLSVRSSPVCNGHEPPLAQAQSAGQRPLAHLHVVVLRTGEMMQREGKLGGRHDAQVGLQAAGVAHARLRLPFRRHLPHLRPRGEPFDDRRPRLRGHEKIEVAHGFQPATQAARMLGAPHLRPGAQPLQDRLGHGEGLPPPVPPRIGRPVANARQDLLLAFLAESVERRHPPLRAGPRQFRDRTDPELLVQRLDLLRAQTGNFQHLHQAGGDRGLQFLVKLQPACRVQFGDFFRQRLADSRDGLQPVFGDDRAHILLQRLQRPRPRMIGAHLEGIFALQFQQHADLLQDSGYLVFGHTRSPHGTHGIYPETQDRLWDGFPFRGFCVFVVACLLSTAAPSASRTPTPPAWCFFPITSPSATKPTRSRWRPTESS